MELHLGDPNYPAALADCPHPPRTLWVRGDLAILDRPTVAIVGTRRATAYAERVTRQLATTLARAGACVISGLARGVDACAHRGALEANGATVAVLGTGLDVCYPKAHASLQRDIATRGLLLSELAPDDAAHPGSFPKRNRIIAALARVTIVVEAPVKSGALITAGHALEMNRTVAVVPGPIDVPQAQGSNELLRDGATALTSMADALALLGLTAPVRLHDIPEGSAERTVWQALDAGGLDLESLSARASLPAHETLAAVGALELRGLVECALTGEIRRM
ncbi:MAG TPA: DNA-processing protein DprA [Gemmatimonadaceae bacterium]|nr:DNA-processing protein DprA [Gemmatimonadaceae bacterium]